VNEKMCGLVTVLDTCDVKYNLFDVNTVQANNWVRISELQLGQEKLLNFKRVVKNPTLRKFIECFGCRLTATL
jgi:hypothetical protein